ncbi:MAG: hypothetical protein R2991_09345 [Thermoanaerobaculia bacterium]
MSLDRASRRRIEELVRPLHAGLDGVDGWPAVVRRLELARGLLAGVEHDAVRLELLVLFHDAVDGLGGLGERSRLHLFLRSLGLAEDEIDQLKRSLRRVAKGPREPEERAVHDALLLGRSGVRGLLDRLFEAARKRRDPLKAVGALDPGPDPERCATVEGARLAAERRKESERWLAELRQRLNAETDGG